MYLTVRYIFVTCFAQVPNKIHIFSWKEARSALESRKIPPSVFKLTHNSWHKYMPYINQQMPLDLSSALISTIGYSRQRGKYSSIIIMFCTIREEYLDLFSQVYKLHIYWCGGGDVRKLVHMAKFGQKTDLFTYFQCNLTYFKQNLTYFDLIWPIFHMFLNIFIDL